jgi:octaprenyl-diphosphate synthase
MLAADSKVVPTPRREVSGTEPEVSWKEIIEPVEPFLDAVSRRLSQEVENFEGGVLPYARYALNGQGKQLRPALVALTANALGQVREEHVTVAVVIEMVHLATLVHDDIIDEAEIRRGRPTLAAQWGNEIAVLFGDCLFANALTLAARFPTTEVCRAVAMATNTVCSGEILQTQQRRNIRLTLQDYFKVLEMKTAELFALSCEMSAYLSGLAENERQALRKFGLAFGTAYQVYDDCVDLFGSEASAGKSLGSDLARGKLTLPVLVLLEKATPEDRTHVQGLVQTWHPAAMAQVAGLLSKYGALEASLRTISQYLDIAREALRSLPASAGRASLLGLTDYLAAQSKSLRPLPRL